MSALAGAIDVDIEYHGQKTKATLLAVEGEGPSLLGRDLLQKVQLKWEEICVCVGGAEGGSTRHSC